MYHFSQLTPGEKTDFVRTVLVERLSPNGKTENSNQRMLLEIRCPRVVCER